MAAAFRLQPIRADTTHQRLLPWDLPFRKANKDMATISALYPLGSGVLLLNLEFDIMCRPCLPSA